MTIGLVTKTRGKNYEELRWGGSRYDTINQGCFEATARVKEMQEDGLQLEVIYPPQRTMRHFMLDEDKEFHLAGVQAYNDWLAKGFVGKAPEHFVGQGQIPNLGIEASVAEMKRCRQMGLRGVVISSWPSGKPFLDDDCDPVLGRGGEAQHPGQRAHQPGAQGPAARADRQHRPQGRGGAHRLQRRRPDHHAADRRRDHLLGPVRQVPDA